MAENLTENQTKIPSERLICEACGVEFHCGANVGECWCFSVELQKETLAKLREDFKNCLCENCLSNFKQERKNKYIEVLNG